MSLEGDTIRCTKCSFSTSSARVWGSFQYVFPSGDRVNADRTGGWCFTCKNIEPIEEFQLNSAIEKRLEELEKQKQKILSRGFLARYLNPKLPEIEFLDEEINEQVLLLRFNQVRQSPPRCMTCGSFEHKNISVVPRPSEGETLDTGIIHPNCGGQFLVSLSGIRFFVKDIPSLYDLEGNKLN